MSGIRTWVPIGWPVPPHLSDLVFFVLGVFPQQPQHNCHAGIAMLAEAYKDKEPTDRRLDAVRGIATALAGQGPT